jgi:2-keto-4-pentenoate hydratase/2-oxohepta-3-ene-1,7-dioic acid hydratase in catechol pathway
VIRQVMRSPSRSAGAAQGTGIVPDESFSLRPGDVVTIDIPRIGTLTNPVILVGRDLDQE